MDLPCLNRFVRIFLLPLGIIENSNYKAYEFMYFLIYYVLIIYVTFGIVIGLHTTSDFGEKGMQFGQLTTHVTSLVMILYYKFSIALVLKLINKLRKNENWPEAAIKMEIFIENIVFKVFCGYYVSIIFTVLPIFLSIASSSKIDEKYSYLIPFWYSCGQNVSNIDNMICWKVTSKYELVLSNIIQAILYTITLHALIMFLLFYTILTTNIKIHAEVLNAKAKKLVDKSKEFNFRILTTDSVASNEKYNLILHFEDFMLKKFNRIMHHQQFVRIFTKEVTDLLQWMILINMIGIFTSLTMTAFFTIIEKTNDSVAAIKMASMSCIMIVTFYIYCYNAQTITDLNESILDGMLDFPWFQRNIVFRRRYAIALTLNQKPLNVKVCKMYVVNLRLFQSFMRGIYSVLNLLLLKYA